MLDLARFDDAENDFELGSGKTKLLGVEAAFSGAILVVKDSSWSKLTVF